MEVSNNNKNVKNGLNPDWTELTWECLINIFSRLSMKQRWMTLMFVCKVWMNVCKEPSLNSVFDFEYVFLSSIDSRYYWSSEFARQMDSMLMSVVERSKGGLKIIRIRHCTNRSLSYVADRCPNLEVISVKHCPKVTDESMTKIALKCSKIKELDISGSYEISCFCMEMFGKNCKNLEIMKRNLVHPTKFSQFESSNNQFENLTAIMVGGSIEVDVIASSMHSLKHLELRYCSLTNDNFASLCEECPNLEYLDLFGCRYLRDDALADGISSLKKLKKIIKPNFPASFYFH